MCRCCWPGSWSAALCLYFGLYHAVFTVVGGSLWRVGGALPWLALPALWVLCSWLRGHALAYAFPWNLLAYQWVEIPGALPLASWVGSHGLSFLVLFANVGVARALIDRRPSRAALGVLVPLLLFALAGRFAEPDLERGGDAIRVDLVQPNSAVSDDERTLAANYRRLMALSEATCDGRAPPSHLARERYLSVGL